MCSSYKDYGKHPNDLTSGFFCENPNWLLDV